MIKPIFTLLFAGTLLAACNNAADQSAAGSEHNDTGMVSAHPHTDATEGTTPDLSAVALDADKDFVCGMPVKGHTADTAQYKGKVYGFCAKECKEEFLKNPESYLAQK